MPRLTHYTPPEENIFLPKEQPLCRYLSEQFFKNGDICLWRGKETTTLDPGKNNAGAFICALYEHLDGQKNGEVVRLGSGRIRIDSTSFDSFCVAQIGDSPDNTERVRVMPPLTHYTPPDDKTSLAKEAPLCRYLSEQFFENGDICLSRGKGKTILDPGTNNAGAFILAIDEYVSSPKKGRMTRLGDGTFSIDSTSFDAFCRAQIANSLIAAAEKVAVYIPPWKDSNSSHKISMRAEELKLERMSPREVELSDEDEATPPVHLRRDRHLRASARTATEGYHSAHPWDSHIWQTEGHRSHQSGDSDKRPTSGLAPLVRVRSRGDLKKTRSLKGAPRHTSEASILLGLEQMLLTAEEVRVAKALQAEYDRLGAQKGEVAEKKEEPKAKKKVKPEAEYDRRGAQKGEVAEKKEKPQAKKEEKPVEFEKDIVAQQEEQVGEVVSASAAGKEKNAVLKMLEELERAAEEQEVPEKFRCACTGEIMTNPVFSLNRTTVYDRSCILKNLDPFTGEEMTEREMRVMPTLRDKIAEWKAAQEKPSQAPGML